MSEQNWLPDTFIERAYHVAAKVDPMLDAPVYLTAMEASAIRTHRAVPVAPPPEGPWLEAYSLRRMKWVVWRDDGADADCPEFGAYDTEAEAIAARNALNSVRGVRPLAPEQEKP